jgi:hypothetical protein
MRGQAQCHWCGQPRPEPHHACAQSAPPEHLPSTASTAPFTASKRPRGLPQGGPRYDRNHGLGTTARSLVLTPLGWSMLSPEVRRRIGRG